MSRSSALMPSPRRGGLGGTASAAAALPTTVELEQLLSNSDPAKRPDATRLTGQLFPPFFARAGLAVCALASASLRTSPSDGGGTPLRWRRFVSCSSCIDRLDSLLPANRHAAIGGKPRTPLILKTTEHAASKELFGETRELISLVPVAASSNNRRELVHEAPRHGRPAARVGWSSRLGCLSAVRCPLGCWFVARLACQA